MDAFGAITDPERLFGRRCELEIIFHRLSSMQSTCIVGKRGLGKSSLLYCIAQGYRAHLAHPELYAIAIFSPGRGAHLWREGEVLRLILLDMLRTEPGSAISRRRWWLKRLQKALKRGQQPDLATFESAIRDLADEARPVLCLDDLDVLVARRARGQLGREFFASWRSLAQTGRLAFVVTATRLPPELGEFLDIFRIIYLDRLRPEDARELVISAGLSDHAQIRLALELGRGHPLALQTACAVIQAGKGMSRREIIRAFNSAMGFSPLQAAWWRLAGWLNQHVGFHGAGL